VRLNLKSIINTLKDVRDYIFPIKKITSRFRSIKSLDDLKIFIQERSAHVTQTTLYGYIKTRIGSRYALMFEDKVFSESINIAKWNIYMSALSDCTLYVFSYLINKKNLKQNDAEKIFISIINEEMKNGLNKELFEKSKINFQNRIPNIDWQNYYLNDPFKNSGNALYTWSPIAEELKILDKEIVINSIDLKWNLVKNEFEELTKDLNFN
tara:strand:- start:1077 stop:1706 length:630 start_codon:yes stop_codon:yes gene_type:complete